MYEAIRSAPVVQYQIKTQPVMPPDTAGNATQLMVTPQWLPPVRTRRLNRALYPNAAIVCLVDTTGSATQLMVTPQWLPPVRTRRLNRAQFPTGQWTYFDLPTETITVDKWYQQWSDPSYKRLRLGKWTAVMASGGVCVGEPTTYGPEEITVDKWFQALSQPVRQRWIGADALRRDFRTEFSRSMSVVFAEDVNVDKWFQPLSEPPRQRWIGSDALRRSLQSNATWTFYEAPPEVVTMDKWFRQWQDPIMDARTRGWKFLRQYQLATNRSLSTTFTEDVNMDKWFAPLSIPKRYRSALDVAAIPFINVRGDWMPPDPPAPVGVYGLGGEGLGGPGTDGENLQDYFEGLSENKGLSRRTD